MSIGSPGDGNVRCERCLLQGDPQAWRPCLTRTKYTKIYEAGKGWPHILDFRL